MDLHLPSLDSLAPEAHYYVFYATQHEVYGFCRHSQGIFYKNNDARKESIYMKYLCLFYKKKKFPGLTNLGTLFRCAQNWYTAVQMDEIPSGSDFISHANTN